MACLLFMRLPWPEGSFAHSATRSWPLVAWMSLWAFILYVLLLSWAGPCLIVGFSFSNPVLTLFVSHLILLPCHPVILAMLLFNLCLMSLFWACYMLSFCSIPIAQHYHWTSTHAVLGFLGPFHRFRASLAHFILLGILDPFHFLGHPRPIPILHSHGLFLSLLGFSDPNCHILYFWGLWAFPPTPYLLNSLLWASLAHSCLLSISHNAHRFTTSFSRLIWVHLLSLRPFCYFFRPMVHYSCHSGLMVFFSIY